jgi:hypothetical protein
MTARVIDLAQWHRDREKRARPDKRKRPRDILLDLLIRGPKRPKRP